ncbi:hypothetical protein V2J56_12565 [Georgenia sp. MJ206]|uniref:lipopolysaccharide biosynthesis protein n=1 Tax=Georgenia wangjunii TaxID=3117730 RepID=UPI002F268ED8
MIHKIRSLRSHSVFRYGAASALPRGLAILTTLVITPLGIERLGALDYGLWVLATQIPALIVSPDLGLGNGIVSEMSGIHRREGGLASQRRRLVGLMKVLAVVAAIWLGVGLLAAGLYARYSTPDDSTMWRLLAAFAVCLASFTAGIPATVTARAQLAQEQGHRAVLWEGVGKAATLITSVAVLSLAPTLVGLVLASVLPTTVAAWINAHMYLRRLSVAPSPKKAPTLHEAYRDNRRVFGLGKHFVLLQVCYLVGTGLDPYIINGLSSTRDVTFASVVRRPYDMLPLIVTMYTAALWPVFARLQAEQRYRRVRRLVVGMSLAGAGIVAAAGLAVMFFRQELYGFLGQGQVFPTASDLGWVTLHVSASVAVLVVTVYLNAISAVRPQVYILIPGTIALLVVKVVALGVGDIHDYFAAAALGYILLSGGPISVLALTQLRNKRLAPGAAS